MYALLQRVRSARVEVHGAVVGQIAQGLLVLLCAEQGDTEQQADKLLAKLLKIRIFADAEGKMNRSVQDVQGGCCWSVNSPWRPIPRAATGPALPRRPLPQKASVCTTMWLSRHKKCIQMLPLGCLPRICRCT